MSSPVPIPRRTPVPGMETYREKAVRKFKQNPWVPVGCAITVGALTVAMVKMRRGESRSFNHWLRVRVAAQGLTIVALVAGTYSLRPRDADAELTLGGAADSTLTRNDMDVERRREEKIAREKEEFEERLRNAEEAHILESTLKGMRDSRTTPEASSGNVEGTGGPGKRKGSWWGWGRSSPGSATGEGPSPSIDSSKKP